MEAIVEKKTAVIITDGSCYGNPGVGGYASIIKIGSERKVISGNCKETTTNNRMELMAVIEAIKQLNLDGAKKLEIKVLTDSQYLITCSGHKQIKWFKDDSRKNNDLWMQLIGEAKEGEHTLTFVKVKAHSGDADNEECDRLAKEQCEEAHAFVTNAVTQVIGG